MNNENNLLEFLQAIRQREGEGFIYDEKAIIQEHHKRNANQSSLAIDILSIVGGFLATIAFMAFLAITGFYNSTIALLVTGFLFIISAIIIDKRIDKLIIDTALVTIFTVGFFLAAYGLDSVKIDDTIISMILFITALFALYFTTNKVLSFIAVIIANVCLLFLILDKLDINLIYVIIVIYAFLLTFWMLNEAKIIVANKKLAQLYDPVRTGLIVSLLISLVVVSKRGLLNISLEYILLPSFAIIPLVLYLISLVLKTLSSYNKNTNLIIYVVSFLILLATAFSPAIAGSILIILLCFYTNYRIGFTMGLIGLVYAISQYYYDLNFTLLTKSGLMVASGVMFLCLYYFTAKNTFIDEEH